MMIRKERLSPTTNDVNLDCFDSELSWLQQMVPSTIRIPQNQSDSLRTKEDEISELSWLQQMVPSTIRTPQNQSDSIRTLEDEILTLALPPLEFDDLLSFLSNNQPEVNQSPKSGSNYSTHSTTLNQIRSCRTYRNYKGKDLLNAIEEVRIGNMSAHQASRKYGVPSRTLYDKVKKLRDGMEVYIS